MFKKHITFRNDRKTVDLSYSKKVHKTRESNYGIIRFVYEVINLTHFNNYFEIFIRFILLFV